MEWHAGVGEGPVQDPRGGVVTCVDGGVVTCANGGVVEVGKSGVSFPLTRYPKRVITNNSKLNRGLYNTAGGRWVWGAEPRIKKKSNVSIPPRK